jgi:hypothetical protein
VEAKAVGDNCIFYNCVYDIRHEYMELIDHLYFNLVAVKAVKRAVISLCLMN